MLLLAIISLIINATNFLNLHFNRIFLIHYAILFLAFLLALSKVHIFFLSKQLKKISIKKKCNKMKLLIKIIERLPFYLSNVVE